MKELVKESAKLFNTIEKWNAFLELINMEGEIENLWFEKLQIEMKKYFNRDNKFPGWSLSAPGGLTYIWFLDKFSENSIALWLENFQLSLWIYQKNHDIKIVNDLLKGEEFRPLFLTFGIRAEYHQNPDEAYLIKEIVNWEIGSSFDGIYDKSHLAWFAGVHPEKVIEQIANKVKPFFKDDITGLLLKLNQQSLIQNIK